jgi:excisionase family DNA binding protein
MDRLLLKPGEVAELVGCGRSKLYQMLAAGEIPSVKLGGSVRVPLDGLRAWLERKMAEGKRG